MSKRAEHISNQILQKLANKIRPVQIILELVLLSLFIVAFLLIDYAGSHFLILLSLGTLAMLYFILAFRIEDPENGIITFLNKLTYLSFTVAAMGVNFTIQHYPYGDVMLKIALFTMVLGLIGLIGNIIFRFKDKKYQKIVDPDIIRIIIIGICIAAIITFGNTSGIIDSDNGRGIENQEIINE